MGSVDNFFIGYFLIVITFIVFYVSSRDIDLSKMLNYLNYSSECNYVDNTLDDSLNSSLVSSNMEDSQELKGSYNKSTREFNTGVYLPNKPYINTADDQDAYLSTFLNSDDSLNKENGNPSEGLMTGGFIPLPYSSSDGVTTNEYLSLNM